MPYANYQNLPVPLYGNLDTKTTEKVVPGGQLVLIENAEQPNPGSYSKRAGSTVYNHEIVDSPQYWQDGISNQLYLTNITDVHTNNQHLIVVGSGNEKQIGQFNYNKITNEGFTYDTNAEQWNAIGKVPQVRHELKDIGKSDTTNFGVSRASTDKYDLYAWLSTGYVTYTFINRTTNSVLINERQITNVSVNKIKAVFINSIFYIFFSGDTYAGSISCVIIDPADYNNETINYNYVSDLSTTEPLWDVATQRASGNSDNSFAVEQTNIYIAYKDFTDSLLKISKFNSDGYVGALFNVNSIITGHLSISIDNIGNNNVFIIWKELNTNDVKLLVARFDISPTRFDYTNILSNTNLTIYNSTAGTFLDLINSRFVSYLILLETNQTQEEAGIYDGLHKIITFTVYTGGASLGSDYGDNSHGLPAPTAVNTIPKAGLLSKLLSTTALGIVFIPKILIAYQGLEYTQNTIYLINPLEQKFDTDSSSVLATTRYEDLIAYGDGYGYVQGLSRLCPLSFDAATNFSLIETTPFGFAINKKLVEDAYGVFEYNIGSINLFFQEHGYQCTTVNNSLYISDGVAKIYDGNIKEHGFLLSPGMFSIVSTSSTGGFISDGTYSWVVLYEKTDSLGNIHRSGPSPAFTMALTGGTNTQQITFQVPNLPFTNENCNIVLYRTTDLGEEYFRTGSSISNIITNANLSLTDTASDDDLADNEIIYYQSPTTLSDSLNEPVPAHRLICSSANRVFMVPNDDRRSIWYSKPLQPFIAIEFSGELSFTSADLQADITALAIMGNDLIIFNELEIKQVDIQQIDANNPFKVNVVPSDVGAVDHRSVVSCQLGILFKSQKGIYLLGRDYNLTYIGKAVEAYNDRDILSAVLVSNKNEIRFQTTGKQEVVSVFPDIEDNYTVTTDSGVILVYNYFLNNWTIFTYDKDNQINGFFPRQTATDVVYPGYSPRLSPIDTHIYQNTFVRVYNYELEDQQFTHGSFPNNETIIFANPGLVFIEDADKFVDDGYSISQVILTQNFNKDIQSSIINNFNIYFTEEFIQDSLTTFNTLNDDDIFALQEQQIQQYNDLIQPLILAEVGTNSYIVALTQGISEQTAIDNGWTISDTNDIIISTIENEIEAVIFDIGDGYYGNLDQSTPSYILEFIQEEVFYDTTETLGVNFGSVYADQTFPLGLDGYATYDLHLKTGWIKPSELQGFARCRRAIILGEYHSSCIVQVDIRYNYEPTIQQTANYDTTKHGYSTLQVPFDWKFRLNKQKFTSIQFEITIKNATGRGIDLTELALEVALLSGHNRLSSNKTGSD